MRNRKKNLQNYLKIIGSVLFLFVIFSYQALFAQNEEEDLSPLSNSNIESINTISLFLGGLPVEKKESELLFDYEKTQSWQLYAQSLEKLWQKRDLWSWKPIREFSKAKLSRLTDLSLPVFYPFSGPDLMFPLSLFPEATTYVLASREFSGRCPTTESVKTFERTFPLILTSLHSYFKAGYFVTKELRQDLSMLGGNVPLFLIMIVRSGGKIIECKTTVSNATIRFYINGELKTLYYFQSDLSNGGFEGSLKHFLSSLGPFNTVIKSASYLLHGGSFSSLRGFLLSRSQAIVQDDSGIPYRYLFEEGRKVALFGVYTPPLNIFKEFYQKDLEEAFSKQDQSPLPFGFGYKWNPKEAGLIVSVKVEN
ncbi:hypothetical protein [Methylacidiphilum caldifontis]|uniref:Uncharacterized protein n=1 Tax=Methylacidiphilum caldifontis TaxID=2795386 RepID=A0A4Y8P8G2_9BACT|nr:hypothetical protein [Methylacidiphilum caldifontis]TFE66911.1 hypothetical protein A7Q10_10090 [Methylacidiphilum caldifontis]